MTANNLFKDGDKMTFESKCEPTSKTISQIIPDFDQQQLTQFHKIEIMNLEDLKPYLLCEDENHEKIFIKIIKKKIFF